MEFDVKLLKTFLTLTNEGSFTSAAKNLGLTQSAVSQQIRLLEREVGAELLIRSNKVVGLTPAGEILRQGAHHILESLEQAQSLIAEQSAQGGGRLRVGAPPTVCQRLMPQVLSAFHRHLPATNIALIAAEEAAVEERLARRDLEFAIALMPVRHKVLAVRELGRDELVLVVRSDDPLSGLERVAASHLRSRAMILPPSPNREYEVWSRFLLESGVFPKVAVETNSLEAAIALVRDGLGVAVAPRWALDGTWQDVGAVPIGRTGLWRHWAVAYPAALHLTAIHRTFLKICSEQIVPLLTQTSNHSPISAPSADHPQPRD